MVKYVGVYIVHQDRLLIHRRSESLGAYLISPGGTVDPGESPLVAAIRETHEESGVELTDLNVFYESPDGQFIGYVSYPQTQPRVLGPDASSRDEIDMEYPFNDFNPDDVVRLPRTGHAFVNIHALYAMLSSTSYPLGQRYFLAAVSALLTRQERLPYDVVFREQHEFIRTLSPQYVQAIKDYTSSDYYENLNRKLCAHVPLSPIEQRIYDDMMYLFRSGPGISTPITLWRGLRANELVQGRLACQFVSTSYELKSALRTDFTYATCCLVKITVPAGARVLPVEHIAEQAGEWEVILPPNGAWTVLSDAYENYEGRTEVMRTYTVAYIPAGGVTLEPGLTAQNTRNVLRLTEEQNAERIASFFDSFELSLYDDDYAAYFLEIAERIGATPMPPIELIMEKLPPTD